MALQLCNLNISYLVIFKIYIAPLTYKMIRGVEQSSTNVLFKNCTFVLFKNCYLQIRRILICRPNLSVMKIALPFTAISEWNSRQPLTHASCAIWSWQVNKNYCYILQISSWTVRSNSRHTVHIMYICTCWSNDILHYFNFKKLIPRKECGLREHDSKYFNLRINSPWNSETCLRLCLQFWIET